MTSTSSEWPTATIKYRLHLAPALHPVSPALSAFHASRCATLHPGNSPALVSSHCPKCGTYYFSGDNPSQLVRPATKKRKLTGSSQWKVLQRTCQACGSCTTPSFAGDNGRTPVPLACTTSTPGSEPSKSVPTTSKKMDQQTSPPGEPIDPLTAATSSKTLRRVSAPPKTKHTNASTLQEMLARDHHRADAAKARKQIKERNEGLTAFLKEL